VEYVAVEDTPSPTLHWNRLEGKQFRTVQHDTAGMIRSKALPGLWIPLDALADRDWWAILAAIERGVTRLGHHEHQETIWHKDRTSTDEKTLPFDAG
jgi:hypothetical protein